VTTRSPQRENVHDQPKRTISLDAAGVDELGVIPWPVMLRRRLARTVLQRMGIDRRYAVMWVVLGGLFTVSCTITVLVVSLEAIADDLGTSVTTMNWTITAPMLAFGVIGPAFGKAGDLWGHKRIFVGGLLMAGVFALATALAWNAASLITFRTLSASAGSACGPSAMAYINRVFAPEDRVKPLGYWSFVTAGAPVIGVVIGAPLVDSIGWRAIFWGQAPLCLIGAVVALWLLPGTDRLPTSRFDVGGAVTLGVASTLALVTISQGSRIGWGSALFITCSALATASMWLFIHIERRVQHPLVMLSWFRMRNVAWPIVTSSLANFAYMGGFILAPPLLSDRLGFSTTDVGWMVIARPLTFAIVAPLAGLLTVRVGERPAAIVGAAGVAASMVVWLPVTRGAGVPVIVAAFALSGAGLGIAVPALTALMSNAVSDDDLGAAGAMHQLLNQMGAVVGSVVLGTVAAASTGVGGYTAAFTVGACVALVSAVCAVQVRSTPR
jgi:MFS family permease